MQVEFSKLYKDYAKRLYLFIFSKCNNTELAEDVVQTAFLKAILNIGSFKEQSSIYSWITKIALNVLNEEWKKYGGEAVSLDSVNMDGEERFRASNKDILEELIENEERSELYSRIEKLGNIQREIVKMRLQEISFRDIGVNFGQSENWAKVNYHRAVKKLKNMK